MCDGCAMGLENMGKMCDGCAMGLEIMRSGHFVPQWDRNRDVVPTLNFSGTIGELAAGSQLTQNNF